MLFFLLCFVSVLFLIGTNVESKVSPASQEEERVNAILGRYKVGSSLAEGFVASDSAAAAATATDATAASSAGEEDGEEETITFEGYKDVRKGEVILLS